MTQTFTCPRRPLILNVTDCAGTEVEKAFLNLYPYRIVHNQTGEALIIPSLVISDGMSNPDGTNNTLQPDTAIMPTHTHDATYSVALAPALDEFCERIGRGKDAAREVADEIFENLLEEYCPRYKDNLLSEIAEGGVRIGGSSSFRDYTRDEWRNEVSLMLMTRGLPGKGCGYHKLPAEAERDIVPLLDKLSTRTYVAAAPHRAYREAHPITQKTKSQKEDKK